MRTLRLFATFYRNFFWFSFILFCCSVFIFVNNGLSSVKGIFWLKIITSFLVYFFVDKYMRKEYFYYRNLGLSKKKIWWAIFSFEAVITTIVLIVVYKFYGSQIWSRRYMAGVRDEADSYRHLPAMRNRKHNRFAWEEWLRKVLPYASDLWQS